MEVKTHRHPKSPCPFCSKPLDAASGGKEGPKNGDLTVCAYCLNWLVFEEDRSLRPISEAEILDLDDEDLKKLSDYSKMLREKWIHAR